MTSDGPNLDVGSSIKKIIVYCLSGLGNVLLFTPTLRRLHEIVPNAEITFLTVRSGSFEVIKECPFIRPLLIGRGRDRNIFWRLRSFCECLHLRRERFDLSFVVFPSNRVAHNLVGALIGARSRVGFRYPYGHISRLGFLQTVLIDSKPGLHDIDNNLLLLAALGVEPPTRGTALPEVWTTAEHAARAEKLLASLGIARGDPFIVYHPVCYPDMRYKRWAPHRFTQLLDRLSADFRLPQLLLGAKSDERELSELADRCTVRPALIYNQDLLVVAEVIRAARLMISNDSGLMQLAGAVQTPVIGLFGPTRESRTGPRGSRAYVVASHSPARPCRGYPFAADSLACSSNVCSCMDGISIDDVYQCIRTNSLLDPNTAEAGKVL